MNKLNKKTMTKAERLLEKHLGNEFYKNITLKIPNYKELVLNAINEALTLTDVVASLLCVDSDGLSFIMEGETYNLIEESDTLYKITDDDGDESYYDKKHFVKN
jgi:hypothetical protein